MIISKPAFLLLLVFLFGNAGFVLAQTDTVPPQIINPDTIPVPYCSDSIPVAPNITIQNIKIDQTDEGMKVSIANYRRGEDKLVYDVVEKFKDGYSWNDVKGELEIRGVGTEEHYREAISKVYYTNIAETPNIGVRSFSISLLDADYLPATTHFYRYIEKLDITWKQARDSAENMEYYGLQGYLATIRSQAENDFIWTKIDGVGWIGATDEKQEGRWEWVTGPDSAVHFWQGNYNGYRVNNEFSFWNTNEPNNVVKQSGIDEDYAHINANPSTVPKSWNDLPNPGDGPNSQYYRAQGFIVEFGGMEGDPEVKLSATASIVVAKIAFSDIRDYEVCKGESQQLNLSADPSYTYSWSPDVNINTTNVSNPIVSPPESKTYVAIGSLDFCTDSAEFFVKVNPLPESLLNDVHIYCKGDSTALDPGEHTSYEWSNGANTRTITIADEAKYWVKLKNDFDCEWVDTVEVKWSVRPELDYSTIDTLVCGTKTQTLNLSFVDDASASTSLIPVDPVNSLVTDDATLNPTITVTSFGMYNFEMQITDKYGCEFIDTLNIEFHNQPNAIIEMDENKCKGYSLELSFGGTTEEDAQFSWYYNDTVFQSDVNLRNIIIPLGYGELNRTVGLKVNEQGCVDSSVQNVTVTPNIEIITNNNEGCTPLLVNFDAKSTEAVGSYLWDFGDGNSSNKSLVTHEYINALTSDTSFNVGLMVVSTEGCENKGEIESLVIVHPKPTVDFSFAEDDCNPLQMEIWYEGSGNDADTYNWDLSELLSTEILQNPGTEKGPLEIKRLSEPTANIGIHVVSEFGCNSDTINKIWKRKPVFELKVDVTEGCPPLATVVNALVLDSVDNVNFSYDLGDGTTGAGNKVDHIFTEANTKSVVAFIGTSLLTGCVETMDYKDTVFVYPVPEAAFTPIPEAVLVSDPEIEFENNSEGATLFEWDFGDLSTTSTEYSPLHRFTDMGFYNVSLFSYNDFGCLDSVSEQVVVAFDKLFPPNAFSPNAIKEEDREFRIHSAGVADEGYNLLIFNRWGEVVFESNSQQKGWDGKMKNGNIAPAGVYTWVLQYSDFRSETHKQQGTVTLIL